MNLTNIQQNGVEWDLIDKSFQLLVTNNQGTGLILDKFLAQPYVWGFFILILVLYFFLSFFGRDRLYEDARF